MKISVIIPAYNSEKTLAAAIQSVLKQTRKADEIIVIDDGSKDETAKIAESFGSDISLLKKSNGGSSQARNHGLAHSSGNWIAFLDSDDQWYPNHLKDLTSIQAKHPEVNWVFGRYDCFIGDQRCRQSSLGTPPIDGAASLHNDALDILACGCSIWTGAVLIRRNCIEDAKGFDEKQKTSHDVDLWYQIAVKNPLIGFAAEPVARYQIGQAGSLTGTATSRGDLSWFRLIERIVESQATLPPHRAEMARRYIAYKIGVAYKNALASGNRSYADWLSQQCRAIGVDQPLWKLRLLRNVPNALLQMVRKSKGTKTGS